MKTIGVVGAGFYGAYIALKLADREFRRNVLNDYAGFSI